MRNKRLITAVIGIPFLYIIVWQLPAGYFAILLCAAAGLGLYELFRMAALRNVRPVAIPGIILGVLMVLNFFQPLLPDLGFGFLVTTSLLIIMVARLFSKRPVESALEDIAVTIFGILYVAMLFGFQGAIRMGQDGKHWLVFMYLVIWASDTAAYYIGTAFGRHRLYEKVSPKKSVEGLGGGLAGAVSAALFCRAVFMPEMGVLEAASLGAILSCVGVAGDLAESLIKRGVGVKDSGSLIPGHGGILDRMDAMLFAAPVMFYYLAVR